MKVLTAQELLARAKKYNQNTVAQLQAFEDLTQTYQQLREIDHLPFFSMFGTKYQKETRAQKLSSKIQALEAHLNDLRIEALFI